MRRVADAAIVADLLYSITDNEMVFRDGRLRQTRDFIDPHTQKITILLVFFTPQVEREETRTKVPSRVKG